ncbi:hypothetical protein [Sphingobacterium daejeonense]|uniref:hypothetical protein n=1 Tax=Sphingobacterium daejeonense TaxID=371142 RepID=UPI0010C42F78|nr:hypothetical protein [Sphingobacterium daejeonense]VTP96985.1 Uncharacterised protein [Sphingobacterium daejeonense]
MICPLANFEEIFQTEKGAVYQCSRKNCYWLDFKGSTTAFKVRDFFAFKKRIDRINIEKMLTDPSRSADFEIIMPFRTDSIFCFIGRRSLNIKRDSCWCEIHD